MNKVKGYFGAFGQAAPGAPISVDYVSPTASDQVRMHRRIAVGGHESFRIAAQVPMQLWRETRWLVRTYKSDVDGNLSLYGNVYKRQTGVTISEQRRVLTQLAIRHGVTGHEGYTFDLLRTPERWADYLYDRESGWNRALSATGAGAWVRLLADKWICGKWLASLGLTTPPTVLIQAHETRPAARLVNEWLHRWGRVVGKPRVGAGGNGVFELRRSGDGTLRLTHYQRPEPAANPIEDLTRLLALGDYIVQPWLTTHPAAASVVDARRVAVMRVVTRDVGNGPELFSACLEAALPFVNGKAFVQHVAVTRDGLLADAAAPTWRPSVLRSPTPESRPAADAHRMVRAFHGKATPGFREAVNQVVVAHRNLPGLFAVAWDIALTPQGPSILEGNAGFGVTVPQFVAGGLLRNVTGPLIGSR